MLPPDFARRINYARETVYQFLNGHYSSTPSVLFLPTGR